MVLDYDGYTALEHVLTHTRDTVFKKQTLEFEKMQRELDRLNKSHDSLLEYTCTMTTAPEHCEKCESWVRPNNNNTVSFFKFYHSNTACFGCEPGWVLEKVFLCLDCYYDGPYYTPESYFTLCTKYKFSYWCRGNNVTDLSDVIPLELFESSHSYIRKSCFNDPGFQERHFNCPHPVQQAAAYIIQRAFRCGWDYRRACDDLDDEEHYPSSDSDDY